MGKRAKCFSVPKTPGWARRSEMTPFAYHEAAHAVFAVLYGKYIGGGGIVVHRDGSGITHSRLLVAGPIYAALLKRADLEVRECLAGPLAETRYRRLNALPVRKDGYGGGDLIEVLRIFNEQSAAEGRRIATFTDSGFAFYVSLSAYPVRRALCQPRIWRAVTAVADAIISNSGYLDGDIATDIIKGLIPPSRYLNRSFRPTTPVH